MVDVVVLPARCYLYILISVMGAVGSSLCECGGCNCSLRKTQQNKSNCENGKEKFTLLAYYNSFLAAKASESPSHVNDVESHPMYNGHRPCSGRAHKGLCDDNHFFLVSDRSNFNFPSNHPFFFGGIASKNHVSGSKDERFNEVPSEEANVAMSNLTTQGSNPMSVVSSSCAEFNAADGKLHVFSYCLSGSYNRYTSICKYDKSLQFFVCNITLSLLRQRGRGTIELSPLHCY